MKNFIGTARAAIAGAMLICAGLAAAQDAYPSKPIRIIVPYGPGSSADLLARLVGKKLAERLGQPVLVDNRPGGNTIIGTEALVKSPADGYSILLVVNSHSIVPNLVPNLKYDAIRDFAPISTVSLTELVLAAHPSVPANNLAEFIALAKAKPGQLNYAAAGKGSTTHLAAEMLNLQAGIKMAGIQYTGAGPAVNDLLGGHVQLFITTPLVTIPHVKSGKLKALAISGDTRLASLPQVPTFAESGLPQYDVKVWYGVLAPAGTPKPIVDKLAGEFARITETPEFRDGMTAQGMAPFVRGPEQFAALIKSDLAKYAEIIKHSDINLSDK